MRASVGGSLRLHRFNKCPFGFVGVVRGLHPTSYYFMPNLFNGAMAIAPYKHDNLTSSLSVLFFNVKIQKNIIKGTH